MPFKNVIVDKRYQSARGDMFFSSHDQEEFLYFMFILESIFQRDYFKMIEH